MPTTKQETLKAGEDIVVRVQNPPQPAQAAQAQQAAAAPTTVVNKTGGDIPQEVLDRGMRLVEVFNQALMQAHEAAQVQIQDTSLVTATGLTWELATAGPFNLKAPTAILRPDRVIQGISGGNILKADTALMLGISYSANLLTQGYLAGKEYDARFTVMHITQVSKGLPPGTLQTPPTFPPSPLVFPVPPGGVPPFFQMAPFHYFLYYFRPALTAGADQELFDINFTVDIAEAPLTPGIPGAGFSNWNFDPYGSPGIPIGVPGQGPQWQRAISGRFLVNDPNN